MTSFLQYYNWHVVIFYWRYKALSWTADMLIAQVTRFCRLYLIIFCDYSKVTVIEKVSGVQKSEKEVEFFEVFPL